MKTNSNVLIRTEICHRGVKSMQCTHSAVAFMKVLFHYRESELTFKGEILIMDLWITKPSSSCECG